MPIAMTLLPEWMKRFPRPIAAATIFFAIAYVINHSGNSLDWLLFDPQNNMNYILANAFASGFGHRYPLIAPNFRFLAGFISGSESSAIAMFTNLHFTTAEIIGTTGLLIGAAIGIRGGLASIISLAKLQNAAAASK